MAWAYTLYCGRFNIEWRYMRFNAPKKNIPYVGQSIDPDPSGDTPARIEDKVRALPANQGLNEIDMWNKIDAEVAAARKAGTLQDNEEYTPHNKHA